MWAAYIAFWVGVAVTMVGKLPEYKDPFDWWTPLEMLAFLGVPALFAYLAGRSDR